MNTEWTEAEIAAEKARRERARELIDRVRAGAQGNQAPMAQRSSADEPGGDENETVA